MLWARLLRSFVCDSVASVLHHIQYFAGLLSRACRYASTLAHTSGLILIALIVLGIAAPGGPAVGGFVVGVQAQQAAGGCGQVDVAVG